MHKQALGIIAVSLLSTSPAVLPVAHAAPPAASSRARSQDVIEGVSFSELSGKIQSVNRPAREVMVADQHGGRATFVVGPEAKNFAQLNAGDDVRVRLTRDVLVAIAKRGGMHDVMATEAADGRSPAAAAVVKVDDKNGVVQLKSTQGNLVDVQVHDREKLAKVKAGQQVTLRYPDAGTVAVLPAR